MLWAWLQVILADEKSESPTMKENAEKGPPWMLANVEVELDVYCLAGYVGWDAATAMVLLRIEGVVMTDGR